MRIVGSNYRGNTVVVLIVNSQKKARCFRGGSLLLEIRKTKKNRLSARRQAHVRRAIDEVQ